MLRDLIQNLVQQTIESTLDDIPRTVVFSAHTGQSYDPDTGQWTENVETVTVRAVMVGVRQDDTNDPALVATGRKLLVPALSLNGLAIDTLDDEVLVDGARHNIVQIKPDPTDSLYSVLVTARQGTRFGG